MTLIAKILDACESWLIVTLLHHATSMHNELSSEIIALPEWSAAEWSTPASISHPVGFVLVEELKKWRQVCSHDSWVMTDQTRSSLGGGVFAPILSTGVAKLGRSISNCGRSGSKLSDKTNRVEAKTLLMTCACLYSGMPSHEAACDMVELDVWSGHFQRDRIWMAFLVACAHSRPSMNKFIQQMLIRYNKRHLF